MKKLYTAITTAIALAVLTFSASANMGEGWSRDKWLKLERLEVLNIEGGLACWVPYNSRIQTALYRAPGNWGTGRYVRIQVMDGPERGCNGIFQDEPPRIGGSAYFSWTPLQPTNASDEAVQEVFTTGNWGNEVPVFRTQADYFNARDKNIVRNVVCKLKKGQQVEFTPYKNWGVGQVVHDNCLGWIDRGVIR